MITSVNITKGKNDAWRIKNSFKIHTINLLLQISFLFNKFENYND